MKAKRNARVAAVQVIFQYYFSKSDIKKIINDYQTLNEGFFKKQLKNFDKKLFKKIILGVCENEKKIKFFIRENLSENWPYDRIDSTITAILSLGIYELSFCKETPRKVIIDEYVSISGLFFSKKNVGFVNGLLDTFSKGIRQNERN